MSFSIFYLLYYQSLFYLINLEVYIGLHCFMSKALTTMLHEGHMMKKENIWHNSKKHSVVNINSNFGKEEELSSLGGFMHPLTTSILSIRHVKAWAIACNNTLTSGLTTQIVF